MSNRREKFQKAKESLHSSLGMEIKPQFPSNKVEDDIENFDQLPPVTQEHIKGVEETQYVLLKRGRRTEEQVAEKLKRIREPDYVTQINKTCLKHEKIEKAEKEIDEKGAVDGYGLMVSALDNFQSTGGGGPLYWFLYLTIFLPYAVNAVGLDKMTTGRFLITAFITWFFSRFVCVFVSYIVVLVVRSLLDVGPVFLVKIKKGSSYIKSRTTFSNLCLHLGINSFWLVFVFLWGGFFVSNEATLSNLVDFSIYACCFSFTVWYIAHLFVVSLYYNVMRSMLHNNEDVEYELHYAFERDRVIFSSKETQKEFPTKQEIFNAFLRDFNATIVENT